MLLAVDLEARVEEDLEAAEEKVRGLVHRAEDGSSGLNREHVRGIDRVAMRRDPEAELVRLELADVEAVGREGPRPVHVGDDDRGERRAPEGRGPARDLGTRALPPIAPREVVDREGNRGKCEEREVADGERREVELRGPEEK